MRDIARNDYAPYLHGQQAKAESNRMNNFALSNADVMTALKNSSAAMSAANATFEETVALITAGQEIAQDSSKVGRNSCPNIQQCMAQFVAQYHGKSVKSQRWSRPRNRKIL